MNLRLLLVFVLILDYSFGQNNPADSCVHHSSIFKDTMNFCDGSAPLSFQFLDKNCLSIGISEESVIELLGTQFSKKGNLRKVTKEKDPNAFFGSMTNSDYYIAYFSHLYCGSRNDIWMFPSSQVYFFFKDGILVGKSYKSLG